MQVFVRTKICPDPCKRSLMYCPLVNSTASKSMSKRKQMQGLLYSFFGGKQSSDDKKINTTSETPAPTKKTRKFQESWKDKYK